MVFIGTAMLWTGWVGFNAGNQVSDEDKDRGLDLAEHGESAYTEI